MQNKIQRVKWSIEMRSEIRNNIQISDQKLINLI